MESPFAERDEVTHTLLLGDCLQRMEEIPSGSVDMVMTDPPYGTTQCKWDTIIPLEPMWEQLKRVTKPNAAIVLMASQPFTSVLVCSNLRMFRHEWVWVKNRGSNFLNTAREPMKEHETLSVFSLGDWTYNKQLQARGGGGVDLVGKLVPCKSDSENYGNYISYEKTH